jgi:pimeloyl-ACP methyl ester carboxylesterase
LRLARYGCDNASVAEGLVRAADGTRLYWQDLGGDGPTVLVPGPGFAEDELGFLTNTCRVVVFHIRNRGRSDPVPEAGQVGLPVEVDDIETVRSTLGLGRVTVLAWSYVAIVAALYLTRHAHGAANAVMLFPAPPRPDLAVRPAGKDTAAARRHAWRAFTEIKTAPRRLPKEPPTQMLAALKRVQETYGDDYDFTAGLQDVDARVLVVHGALDHSPVEGSAAWARAFSDARLLVIDDAGHFPLDASEEIQAALKSFVHGEWPADAVLAR